VRQWVLLVGLPLVAASSRVIDFDGLPVGAMPPGWSVAMTTPGAPAKWEVLKDQTAPTQPYVLAQVSNGPAGNRFPLAILEGVQFRDGDVSVRIKPVAGGEDNGGGLVWRYRDERNHYLLRANAADKTVAVFRVQNGQRTAVVAPAKYEFQPNGWSILKVSARGNRFQVYVDHRRILEGNDATFTGAGRVGLCTVAESVMYFDDFRVNPR
jgi:hypothetical protein